MENATSHVDQRPQLRSIKVTIFKKKKKKCPVPKITIPSPPCKALDCSTFWYLPSAHRRTTFAANYRHISHETPSHKPPMQALYKRKQNIKNQLKTTPAYHRILRAGCHCLPQMTSPHGATRLIWRLGTDSLSNQLQSQFLPNIKNQFK